MTKRKAGTKREPVAWILKVQVKKGPGGGKITVTATTASRATASALGDEWLKKYPSAAITIYPIYTW